MHISTAENENIERAYAFVIKGNAPDDGNSAKFRS
jgi:hypothetical protein